MMLCGVCGTRNLPDERHCDRCGARLEPPRPEPEPVAGQELSPAEKLAMAAREHLEAGDTQKALESARRAAVTEPSGFLPRLVLGEVYLHIDAPDDALREFRRAAELDPDSAEAKEKAEVARRRIARPREAEETEGAGWVKALTDRKQLIAVAAGVIATLLVFSIGAAAIVGRTSPRARRDREFRQQMRLGGEHYGAGRYEEAAQAFTEAARLKPGSDEAKRRLQDARAIAGLPAYAAPAAQGLNSRRVVTISPGAGPSPFPPRFVGPQPRSQLPAPTGSSAPPPPPIPVPPMRGTGEPGLPPPSTSLNLDNDIVDTFDGHSRRAPGANIGHEVAASVPGAAETSGTEAPSEPADERKPGRIVIRRHESPPPSAAATQPAESEPKPSAAQDLRAEAERLRKSGRMADAARKYGEAAARFRDEASQGGAASATKLGAAGSCERAQQLCESQAN